MAANQARGKVILFKVLDENGKRHTEFVIVLPEANPKEVIKALKQQGKGSDFVIVDADLTYFYE